MAVTKPFFKIEGFSHFPRVFYKNPQSVLKTISFVLNHHTLSEGFTETLSAEGFKGVAQDVFPLWDSVQRCWKGRTFSPEMNVFCIVRSTQNS